MPPNRPLVFLSLPGLRRADLGRMPALSGLCAAGESHELTVGFPAVTWPVEATLLTGTRPDQHGILANGLFDRSQAKVQMWTFGNEAIERPQIWDHLHQAGRGHSSAAWFPMLSKRSRADYVCMPAPVHNPDGSESVWCYSQPQDLYRELLERLGPFPLQYFWGPLANIKSSQWIADSAVIAAEKFRPDFFYVYLPHLDYAAQKYGPRSGEALRAVTELDLLLGGFSSKIDAAYGAPPVWVFAGEYCICEVSHVVYPNRVLREHRLLNVQLADDGEQLDFKNSPAWAMVDHQFAHVFVRDSDARLVDQIARLFAGQPGIRQVISGEAKAEWNLDHPRCGDLVLVSEPYSWQAYYWWLDDRLAPAFARTVDIHRKPGYDPVELQFDPATRSIPLDATLAKGSHGVPSNWVEDRPLIATSQAGMFSPGTVADLDVCPAILRHFGVR